MDREKVISTFEKIISVCKEDGCDFVDLTFEDAEQILALLKEQEAVTIKKTKEHGFGVYGGICPKCRNWIQSAHSFCGFCGQAVKWE